MKKRLLLILGLVLMMLVSCGKPEDAAKKDFEKSMEAMQKGDLEKIGAKKEDMELLKHFSKGYSKITYKINEVKKVSDDAVAVNTTIKYPDLSGSMQEFMKKSMENPKKFMGKTDKEIEEESKKMLLEIVDQKLSDPNLKFQEKTIDVLYTKDSGKWQVDPNKNMEFIQVMTLSFEK